MLEMKLGSGRPKSARCQAKIDKVAELICSQEDAPGTSKSIREISVVFGVSKSSVVRIAEKGLGTLL